MFDLMNVPLNLNITPAKAFRNKNEEKNPPAVLKGKPKHPNKVHVWAGISNRGSTSVAKIIFAITLYVNG